MFCYEQFGTFKYIDFQIVLNNMVREGWKTIAIREDYYSVIEERARMNRRSVSGELEKILMDAGIIKDKEDG
jgi:hypothetical protein